MNAARMILGYSLSNLRRNWWVLGYGLLFLFLTDALFRFGGGGPRVAASLMNVVKEAMSRRLGGGLYTTDGDNETPRALRRPAERRDQSVPACCGPSAA